MSIRIAIPEPTSLDASYNARSFPPYLAALQAAGLTPILVPLHERPDRVARPLAGTQGVLLPGSRYDVDPQKYGHPRHPACADADPAREAADELLLQDAFNLRKPILAICYGAQSLNVWRNGSLIQDLLAEGMTGVNHAPGRQVEQAHTVEIETGSRLASMLEGSSDWVNSSHHQALRIPGDNLRATAVSPDDGVIEAVELNASDHFVLGVQWHPERTYTSNRLSRKIFAEFAGAASEWRLRTTEAGVVSE